MSDTFTDGYEGEAPESQENANLRQLREQAKAGKEAQQQVADLSRKLAVLESGIDADSSLGKLFLKGYDGEVTGDAIKQSATEYGIPFKGQTQEAPVDEQPQDSGTETRQELADQAPADTGESADPNQTARDNFKRSIEDGRTTETAAGDFIATLAQAALNGDQRVIVQ
jgi:hypothetical protein